MRKTNVCAGTSVLNKIQSGFSKAAPVAMAAAMAMALNPAFAAASVDINSMLSKVMTVVYGFLYFAGVINIVLGIVNIAGAMGEEGGQDAQQLQKGKGRIIRGAIMVAAPSVLLILGINPTTFSIN